VRNDIKTLRSLERWAKKNKISKLSFSSDGFSFEYSPDAFKEKPEKPKLIQTQEDVERRQQQERDELFWSA
jgi:hypothetical protein